MLIHGSWFIGDLIKFQYTMTVYQRSSYMNLIHHPESLI